MRCLLIAIAPAALLFALSTSPARAQTKVPIENPQLSAALIGRWTGVLAYRDYSEPATSPNRVYLPTWLTITPAAEGLRLTYTYDDGPGKILSERSVLVIDTTSATYNIVGTEEVISSYTVAGLDHLKDGRGKLILFGAGKDNGKPSEIRTTFDISRNMLTWLEEVRPAGSHEPFVFRHLYRLTRADAPAP